MPFSRTEIGPNVVFSSGYYLVHAYFDLLYWRDTVLPSQDSVTYRSAIVKLWRSGLATDERCITVGFATANQSDNDRSNLSCR